MTGGPEIEIGVADAADDGFLVLQLRNQPRRDVEPVHDLGVAGGIVSGGVHEIAHLSKVLPPVNSGERISATGACVVRACLIERSTMNSNSSSLVAVWCSMASESRTGRMVRHTNDCP